LREETEWVETVHAGGNILTGVEAARIREAVSTWESRFQAGKVDFSAEVNGLFGDGSAADKIGDALLDFHQSV
jgi:UDP-N-acetylglucosamine 2-epimerase